MHSCSIAAHFVETCISAYERHRKDALAQSMPMVNGDPSGDSTPGKECLNLVVLISELYNFQVVSCVLIYDLIRDLLAADVAELNIELLLKMTRSKFARKEWCAPNTQHVLDSGQQLRQDDPLALRDIVQLVQAKLGDKSPRELGCGVSFCQKSSSLQLMLYHQFPRTIHARNTYKP